LIQWKKKGMSRILRTFLFFRKDSEKEMTSSEASRLVTQRNTLGSFNGKRQGTADAFISGLYQRLSQTILSLRYMLSGKTWRISVVAGNVSIMKYSKGPFLLADATVILTLLPRVCRYHWMTLTRSGSLIWEPKIVGFILLKLWLRTEGNIPSKMAKKPCNGLKRDSRLNY